MVKTLLLFGITGMTGNHVGQQAAKLPKDQYRVVALVRNPTKLSSEVASTLEIVTGDALDRVAVSHCVHTVKPDAIIVVTNVGFTNDLTKQVNKILLPYINEALEADGRQSACKIIYLSGSGSPNPPIKQEDFEFSFIFWLANIKAAVADNNAAHNFFFTSSPSLNFTVVKMGMVAEGALKGVLIGKKCTDDMTFGICQIVTSTSVTFSDVATYLLTLACSNETIHRREFLVMEYAKA